MKVAVIGSGGREHAICNSLKNSNNINKIYCIPGNAGTNLITENVSNIVVTRPTKSVDEEHGYLPGNIDKKLAPWIQPIYDSLSKCNYSKIKLKNKIEIAPLAYMRGRTFDNSWIIADEMQNATINQTKMLLTRIGSNSKLVITGDIEQTDIENSGLLDFIIKLQNFDSEYIEYIELDSDDIIRHNAVKEVLSIYEKL